MPMRGLLNITYYSGEGTRRKNCRPYINFRKSLLNLVSKILSVCDVQYVHVFGACYPLM